MIMEAEPTYRVFVLRHQTPRSYGAFLNSDVEDFNFSALEPSRDFLSHLAENIAEFGELITGPGKDTDDGIVTEHVVCLFKPWLEMWDLAEVSPRVAVGEIFEAASGIYYLQEDSVMKLEGEVFMDWFDGDHGRRVPDLDAEITRRLRKSCRRECCSLGYNAAALREIMPRWIESVWTQEPREWTWSWLNQELTRIADALEESLSRGRVWYVYEQLHSDDVSIPLPFPDGMIVTAVIEAAVDDMPGVRQWLVQASPTYSYTKLRFPELETIRQLAEHEIYASRSGILWIRNGAGVRLGEIASDIVADRHGDIVEDLEERVREDVVEAIVERAAPRLAPDDDLFQALVQFVHDLVSELEVLSLWFHQLDALTDQCVERISTTHDSRD
jgi:hypothetical protein